MATYEDALKAQREVEGGLFQDPNVVYVGASVEIDSNGQRTGKFVVHVGLISAEVEKKNLRLGRSIIPPEHIVVSEYDPSVKNHVPIILSEEDIIVPASQHRSANAFDIQSLSEGISSDNQLEQDPKARVRPCPGGVSVGHYAVTAGSIGLLLEYDDIPNVGKKYIVSNNHVLACANTARVGDLILQPGVGDGGRAPGDIVARLYRFVPLRFHGTNKVDVAIAEVVGGLEQHNYASPSVLNIGVPNNYVRARTLMEVEKCGRATGHTWGYITSVSASIKVKYPNGQAQFVNQITTNAMATLGDSGACLFEEGSRKPVGLFFARCGNVCFYNHFSDVLSELSSPCINRYSEGDEHCFKKDYRLQIARPS